jgi:hypothetical protein
MLGRACKRRGGGWLGRWRVSAQTAKRNRETIPITKLLLKKQTDLNSNEV